MPKSIFITGSTTSATVRRRITLPCSRFPSNDLQLGRILVHHRHQEGTWGVRGIVATRNFLNINVFDEAITSRGLLNLSADSGLLRFVHVSLLSSPGTQGTGGAPSRP